MKIQIATCNDGSPVFWTDETSSSRYGIGTVSLGNYSGELVGEDFGPADRIPGTDFIGHPGRTSAKIATDYVTMDRACAAQNQRNPIATEEEVEILSRFCAQWPTGPQIA